MSRCILVLGTRRSGTSAVAGVLHKLGVSMGTEFVPADNNNPYGTFEDAELFAITRRSKIKPSDYAPLIAERNKQALWGIKDPALTRVAHHIIPLLDDARVIVAKRNRADTVNSYMRAYGHGRAHANRWHDGAMIALARQLVAFNGPVLEVDYDDLMSDPEGWALKLMHFAYDGLGDLPTVERLRDAAHHIQPKKLRAYPMGWGNIAVGVRVAKHPEPGFFADWSALLTGGLRSGDTVLMPQSQMPAHWAANNIARDFLRTDKDTLLMVDDDMTFAPDAVHKLRENGANWNYDVVMAFATHRIWPPRPVVMWLEDERKPPHSLRGDHFTMITDFKDGEVVEVDAVGLAFTLIRRRVLEAMVDDEWGVAHSYFFGYDKGVESDDIGFCRRCRKLGFRMAIDTSIKIGHIGTRPLGWADYRQWLAQRDDDASVDLDAGDWSRILALAAAHGNEKAQELLNDNAAD